MYLKKRAKYILQVLDPEKTRERQALLQHLRELTAERIKREAADNQLALKRLCEKNDETATRLLRVKNGGYIW